ILIVSIANGVLANDADPDVGDTKTVVAVNGQAAAVGQPLALSSGTMLRLQADGSYRFNPNGKFESLRAGESAAESFTYTMADGAGTTSTATVTITIQGENDAPIAVNDSGATTASDVLVVAATAGLLTND